MNVGFVQFSYGTVILGAGSVVGSLIEDGHRVTFFNLNNALGTTVLGRIRYAMQARAAVTKILRDDCEIVFFSAMSMDMPLVIDMVRRIKKRRNIPVLVGGVHATIVRGHLLEEYPEIDYICVGEGESMVKEVVSEDFAIGQIQNLGWRKEDGTIIVNPIRPPEDLSNLPAFPWYLYPRKYAVDGEGYLFIRATRGCPHACNYCCNAAYLNLYGKGYLRHRPIPDIIQEMSFLKGKYQPGVLYFTDEMLIWDKEYSLELFREIKKTVNHPFGFLARVEYIDEEIVQAAKECGCVHVGLGVECGDEQFRKEKLNRHNTNEQIIEAFRILKEHGIKTASFNIIGYPFPGEEERIQSTVKLNELLQPDFVQFTIFFPFLGTKLYDYCVLEDMIDTEKQKRAKNIYDESILKGVSLHDKRNELSAMFNKEDVYRQ